MEPLIKYVTTRDGASIAYYAIGQGPAVVFLMCPWSNLTAEWDVPVLRVQYTAAAQISTFVRLDLRGFGLSDRDPLDFELDSMVRDIDVVVDTLDRDNVRLYALGYAVLPALAYSGRNPDRVTHLVISPPVVRDIGNDRIDKLTELGEIDWDLATNTIVRSFNPYWPEDQVRQFGALIRASIERDSGLRFIECAKTWNAEADAAAIVAPTLLLHDRNNPNMDLAETRAVAGLIRDSRVAFIESPLEAAVIVQKFFRDEPIELPIAGPEPASGHSGWGVRTVLFTDLVGHTEMMTRLGDKRGRTVLRDHEAITREVLTAHGGAEIKTMGDGFMASFGSVTKAVECAIALQKAFGERDGEPLSVRVGLNAGEPIEEDGDLFGAAVILASRIAAKAGGGEILVADTVRGLCSGKGFLFADRGEFVAKGIEEPVRVYEVSWRRD